MPSKKQNKLGIILIILIALSGCTTNTNDSFCLIYEPVYMNYEKDTTDTIKQVDKNNMAYDELCLSWVV